MKDGSVFAGFNDSVAKIHRLHGGESHNWFMLTGDRDIAQGRGGHVTLDGMLSLEPFTMHAIGSPQVFQTSGSYHGAPLIDYQHPHDLVMGLGASYRITHERLTYSLGAYVVGAPALDPTAFMHRESARDNPQVPLAHHMMDSTHITPGVVNGRCDVRQSDARSVRLQRDRTERQPHEYRSPRSMPGRRARAGAPTRGTRRYRARASTTRRRSSPTTSPA